MKKKPDLDQIQNEPLHVISEEEMIKDPMLSESEVRVIQYLIDN